MEEWVTRALKRWPNVPALYGWLRLTRRGRWLIKGETISRPQIIETINNNYAADKFGRWYFQNGPQRGYMQLEYAPLVLRVHGDTSGDILMTHTGLQVNAVSQVFIDEEGAMLFSTEHGPAAIADDELDWALQRMHSGKKPIDEAQLAKALALPSGTITDIELSINARVLSVERLDTARAPEHLQFIRDPAPMSHEPAAACLPNE